MDTLRGNFGPADDYSGYDDYDLADDAGGDLPPVSIGAQERRMQVRAYNHWTSLLQDRCVPSIEDLKPDAMNDFGPHSVLLDFTSGVEDPAILHLGKELATECGTETTISRLSDVPSLSLLSRITDHYMQILANQTPIGFEAEFVNQRNMTIVYRGILLPYSSDGETIDFIYGVINWKEVADQITTDELMQEISQAFGASERDEPQLEYDDYGLHEPLHEPVSDWADGPGDLSESAPQSAPEHSPQRSAMQNLRKLAGKELSSLDSSGPEFGIIMVRRMASGEIVMLGEVNDDIPLIEKVAQKITG